MGQLTEKITEKAQDIKDAVKYLFDNTTIEVALFAVF
jgi:hypothetical protein